MKPKNSNPSQKHSELSAEDQKENAITEASFLYPVTGYALFGFLLGFVAGLTSGEIAQYLLGVLLGFVGGGIGYFIQKNSKVTRMNLLGAMLAGFSIFCCLGLSSGIIIKVNRLFSLIDTAVATDAGSANSNGYIYLKSSAAKDDIFKIRGYLNLLEETDDESQLNAIENVRNILDRVENELQNIK